MVLKRRADLLVDGVYKRITIWDALDMKKNHPDFWHFLKVVFCKAERIRLL